MSDEIYEFVKEIFPICRSIMGEGNRETLNLIQNHIPITIHEVPTGYQAYDWEIPKEWNIRDAYIVNPSGDKVIDFKENNLHIMSYSIPVDKEITLKELQKHLYSVPEQPNAIPYITSYYEPRWGFCITHEQRQKLKNGKYKVYVDSDLKDGSLSYGELIIPGKSKKEILLTTYICHPSMANNECSGPAVTTFLAKWLISLKEREYTYRIVFAPETIGAIIYINKNYDDLKNNTVAGFNITCVGDNRAYSFMPSRNGDTLSDRVSKHVLNNFVEDYDEYSFLTRGSDERQYCHPTIDLPVVSIMRSKYGTFPEYHTSLDNLDFISPEGLNGAFDIIKKCLCLLEGNKSYTNQVFCEPKMSKRNLHPKEWHMRHLGNREDLKKRNTDMMNVMVYSDGKNDIIDISEKININFEECLEYVDILYNNGILREENV